jgi:hypothetical protein
MATRKAPIPAGSSSAVPLDFITFNDRPRWPSEYLSWPNVVNMLGDHDCSACNVANVLIPFDE